MPLITFEGSEGCGKSTQVKRLGSYLEKRGLKTAVFREPGGTSIGEAIRQLLQYSEDNRPMTAETELLLFEAARTQLVREKVRPALESGIWVVCDRFLDSTTVYQGAARRLNPALVEELNRFAIDGCIPDITFVLDIDSETARSRVGVRKVRDRMEEQSPEFYERVRVAYRELARREPARVVLIDGRSSVEQVEDNIHRALENKFSQLRAVRAGAAK